MNDALLESAIEARMLDSLGLLEPGEPTRFGHALMRRHLMRGCPILHGAPCRVCEDGDA